MLARSKTLVWNGPFGAFEVEPFDTGTIEVAEAVAELTAAKKLVSFAGGGDTVAALNVAGVMGRLSHVSTAGGAFLKSLKGKTLPGVEVLLVRQTPRPRAHRIKSNHAADRRRRRFKETKIDLSELNKVAEAMVCVPAAAFWLPINLPAPSRSASIRSA